MHTRIKASAKVEYPKAPIAIAVQTKSVRQRNSAGRRLIRSVNKQSPPNNTAVKSTKFTEDVPSFRKIVPKPCCNMPSAPEDPPPQYAMFFDKAPNKS
jgi:hypothetical protein